jgi:hypothetical protein
MTQLNNTLEILGDLANVEKKHPNVIITLGSIFHVFSPFPRKSVYSKM